MEKEFKIISLENYRQGVRSEITVCQTKSAEHTDLIEYLEILGIDYCSSARNIKDVLKQPLDHLTHCLPCSYRAVKRWVENKKITPMLQHEAEQSLRNMAKWYSDPEYSLDFDCAHEFFSAMNEYPYLDRAFAVALAIDTGGVPIFNKNITRRVVEFASIK